MVNIKNSANNAQVRTETSRGSGGELNLQVIIEEIEGKIARNVSRGDGLARQRRRFTSSPSTINVQLLLNQSQFAIFEAWYKFEAKEGAEFFDIDLLGGIGLTTHTARFTRQFDAQLKSGTLWDITTELEIRERPTLDEGALGILLDSDYNMLIASIDALHNVVHNGTFIKEI